MMETMIPPQVGMRLRVKNKIKREKKEAIKKRKDPNKKKKKMGEKERRDNVTISFSTLVLQSSTLFFM